MAQMPIDAAVLPLLVSIAIALAMLLMILAIAVTTGVGRLGRLGVDHGAATEGRWAAGPGSEGSPGRRAGTSSASGTSAAGIAAGGRPDADPWREAGRRLTTVAGSS